MSARDMATIPAATWRYPPVSGGKVGVALPMLTGLLAVPTLPLTPELAQSIQLEAAREARVTWLFAPDDLTNDDIREGDLLAVEGEQFIIRSVAEWVRQWNGSFVECVIEQNKLTVDS